MERYNYISEKNSHKIRLRFLGSIVYKFRRLREDLFLIKSCNVIINFLRLRESWLREKLMASFIS